MENKPRYSKGDFVMIIGSEMNPLNALAPQVDTDLYIGKGAKVLAVHSFRNPHSLTEITRKQWNHWYDLSVSGIEEKVCVEERSLIETDYVPGLRSNRESDSAVRKPERHSGFVGFVEQSTEEGYDIGLRKPEWNIPLVRETMFRRGVQIIDKDPISKKNLLSIRRKARRNGGMVAPGMRKHIHPSPVPDKRPYMIDLSLIPKGMSTIDYMNRLKEFKR